MTVQLRKNADQLVAAATTVSHGAANDTLKGGIARGTVILTMKGEVPVEALTAGDRVITRERGMAVIRGIEIVEGPACTIRTDSLGLARPERDTTVAADQHVAVRDWRAEVLFDAGAALVPARRLCDGKQIAAFGEAEFFRLRFDTPLTVYANGLETPTGRTETGVIEILDGD